MEACEFEGALRELEAGDALVRARAASRLAESKDARVVEPIITALRKGGFDDDDGLLAAEVMLLALARLGDRRAIPAFIEQLRDGEDGCLQSLAADLLGYFGGEEAERALREKFLHPDCAVHDAVGAALVRVNRAAAGPFFLAQLARPEPYVLAVAAEALGEVWYEPAVLPLQRLARHRDPDVRRAAVDALKEIIGDTADGLGLAPC